MKGGGIGMSLTEGLAAYLKIPPDKTGIVEAVYFADLLDFLIWERFWQPYIEIEFYFDWLNERRADLCIKHLRREVAGDQRQLEFPSNDN
jgi:hypothetical protein